MLNNKLQLERQVLGEHFRRAMKAYGLFWQAIGLYSQYRAGGTTLPASTMPGINTLDHSSYYNNFE